MIITDLSHRFAQRVFLVGHVSGIKDFWKHLLNAKISFTLFISPVVKNTL